MRKYLIMFIGLLMTLLLLAGCGRGEPKATPAPSTIVPPTLAIATLAPSTTVSSTTVSPATAVSTTPTIPPKPTSQGDSAQGQTLFASTCVPCHGPKAEGVKGLGKDMTMSQFIKSKSDPDLLTFINQGRPINDPLNTTGVPMPPKGGNPALTDAQLLDIIAYIRTLQK
jgi:mono/diheme cytochrome c family protein